MSLLTAVDKLQIKRSQTKKNSPKVNVIFNFHTLLSTHYNLWQNMRKLRNADVSPGIILKLKGYIICRGNPDPTLLPVLWK